MSKYTSSKNVEESSSRIWACNAALTSTSKLDSDASKSTRVVQDFGVTIGETEEPGQRGTILHGFLRYLEILGSADFARETLAIVVGLRSSATDADVRPLAILMGARFLLKN